MSTIALANQTAGGLVNTTPEVRPPSLDRVFRQYFLNSTASTNINLIQSGHRALSGLYATNIGATVAYVKLYNKATAPVLATDVPVMIIPLAAAAAGMPGVYQISSCDVGYRFPLGIGIAITGGIADTDATAVAAGQVKVHLSHIA